MGILRVTKPQRCTTPVQIARNRRNGITCNPDAVVKRLDARSDKNRGDKPKTAVLSPDAIPG